MRFSEYFRLHKNKIFAVGFAALSLAIFFAYYGVELGFNGLAFFTSNPFEIWNCIIVLIAYFTIFYCNVTNDAAAYRGIIMFLFLIVFSQILNLFPNLMILFLNFATLDPAIIAFTILEAVFLIGQVVVGVFLYLRVQGYRMMRYHDFRKIRLLSILFSAALILSLGFSIGVLAYGVTFSTPLDAFLFYFLLFALPVSEALMSVSVIFTLERLRRY